MLRAQRGDDAAYGQLVDRHAAVAFRTAYVLAGSAADAEEAAQDAFVKAYRALGRFRAGAPWRPWLLRIVANEARNRRRAAGRRARVELRAAADPAVVLAAPSSESLVLASERDAGLRAALAELEDRDREVLYLRYFLDLGEAEMAAVLDCRPGTVKSRSRGRSTGSASDWRCAMSPEPLEARLRALGAEADLPPAPPSLAAAVRARVAAEGAPPRRHLARRPLAVALAALVLVPAAAVAAIPDARDAVLEWLGLRGVSVRTVPDLPRVAPREIGSAGELGRPSSLARARAGVRFPVLVPAALGAPDRVYLGSGPPGGRVSLVYDRPGGPLLVTQVRGRRPFIEKLAGPGTTIEPVRVGASEGVWITGAPHVLFYEDARGAIHPDTARVAGNVLFWERDGVLLRLEGEVSRGEALRLARSFR